jgi:hypothetical protein
VRPLLLARGADGLVPGLVLAQDVREQGRVALAKGTVLAETDVQRLRELAWDELHLVEMGPGDLHEDEAGRRLSVATAGDGVEVQAQNGGAWPLVAKHRGLLELSPSLTDVNELDDVIVYALPHQRVVLEGELVARAKIVPFVTRREHIERAEAIAAGAGLLRVRPFVPMRVAAVVQESLDEANLQRFRKGFQEKLSFFGSELVSVQVVPAQPQALAAALQKGAAEAQVVAVAGSKPMDPLDASLRALQLAGARMEKHGAPAHPGTLLWLAYLGEASVLGMPSCGLFSKATVLDLLLPRIFAGERLSRRALAQLGDSGLLTREMAHRFPPYRAGSARGELEPP